MDEAVHTERFQVETADYLIVSAVHSRGTAVVGVVRVDKHTWYF